MKSQLDIQGEVPVLEVDQGNGVNEMHQTPTAVPNFTQWIISSVNPFYTWILL